MTTTTKKAIKDRLLKAIQECRGIYYSALRGRASFGEMHTYLFKQVSRHRYSQEYMDAAIMTIRAYGMKDFDAKAAELIQSYDTWMEEA